MTLKKTKKGTKDQPPARITNETVAEHRERILAGGRRFKYPHQYVKHRLVINAILIGVGVLLAAGALAWWQLYVVQNTSNFMYRVTRVVPVPVASVDGTQVRYSDYLMRYRSQEQRLRQTGQLGIEEGDGERQLNHLKSQTMDGLVRDVYAEKRANELGISVSEQDVQAVVDRNRNTQTGQISQQVYDAALEDLLGYSPEEYRHITRQALITQAVAYAVDTQAKATMEELASQVSGERPKLSFEKAVAHFEKKGVKLEFGASGFVPKTNTDGRLATTALTLEDGQVSAAVKSTTNEGYYYAFVQRVEANASQISYRYIKVPVTAFGKELDKLQGDKKVSHYIAIPEVAQVKR